MNCQSDACASRSSRAACSSTGRAGEWCQRGGCGAPEAFLDRPQSRPGPRRLRVEPHTEIAAAAPRSRGEIERRRCTRAGDVRRRRPRMDGSVRIHRAICVGEERRPLEPPMPEQFRVERRDDQPFLSRRAAPRDVVEQAGEVCGVLLVRERPRGARVVWPLVAERNVGTGHFPEPKTAGKRSLVKLEIAARAGIAFVAAPDVARGRGVAHERTQRAARGTNCVIAVWRSRRVSGG